MSLSHHLHSLLPVGNMKRRSVPRAWSAGSYYSWDTVTHIYVKRRLRLYCNSKFRKNIWNHLELYFSTLSVHSVPSTWSWAVRTKERTSFGYIKIAILSKDKLLHSFLRQMLRNLNWNLQIVSNVFSFTKEIYIWHRYLKIIQVTFLNTLLPFKAWGKWSKKIPNGFWHEMAWKALNCEAEQWVLSCSRMRNLALLCSAFSLVSPLPSKFSPTEHNLQDRNAPRSKLTLQSTEAKFWLKY